MAEVKVFRIKREERQPIEFHLAFDKVDEEGQSTEEVEKFHAHPNIPGFRLLDVAASMTGEGGEQAAAIRDFLTNVVVDEDRERWLRILNDPKNVVDADVIAQIADYLMEQYGDRPTETA